MQSIKNQVEVTKVPPGGEIHILSSFRLDYWKIQPKLEYFVVKEPGTYKFYSTNEIYIITNCALKYQVSCGTFEFKYSLYNEPEVIVEFPNYAMFITIYAGFGTMILSFIYFEN